MKRVAFHESYVQKLPSWHRFPMEKYDLLIRQLLHEGTIDEQEIFEPERIDIRHVTRVHDEEYVKRLINLKLSKNEQRKTGFVHDQTLIERELRIMEGTRYCVEQVLAYGGVAFNIAGGTHHAFTNRGEGFCLLNDNAIAAAYLLDKNPQTRILILDLDVHQGNGTAEIFSDEKRVFTFSMHGKFNYPLHKESSDLDIALDDGVDDQIYTHMLESELDQVFDYFRPQFLFYLCGADVLASDKLGRLNLSMEGCLQRDKIVFSMAKRSGIPVVCSMGGGYSPEIMEIVETHANTFRTGMYFFN